MHGFPTLNYKPLNEDAIVYPTGGYGQPAQPGVPREVAGDYEEARAILKLSPNAAAALARRSLQHLIRSHLGHRKKNLYQEIEAVLTDAALPTPIAEQLHAIREIGNLGAHPLAEVQTGTIVQVEPEEAQWLVDVLYDLFDHYFVKPAAAAGRLAAMRSKVASLMENPGASPSPLA